MGGARQMQRWRRRAQHRHGFQPRLCGQRYLCGRRRGGAAPRTLQEDGEVLRLLDGLCEQTEVARKVNKNVPKQH